MMLRQKFLLPTLALISAAVISVGISTYLQTYAELENHLIHDMERALNLLETTTNNWVAQKEREVSQLAQSQPIRKAIGISYVAIASRKVVSARLKNVTKTAPHFRALYLVNSDVDVLSSSNDKLEIPELYKKQIQKETSRLLAPRQVIFTSFREDGMYRFLLISRVFSQTTIPIRPTDADGFLIADVSVKNQIISTFHKTSVGDTGFAELYDKNGINIMPLKPNIQNVLNIIDLKNNIGFLHNYVDRESFSPKMLMIKRLTKQPWIIGTLVEENELTHTAYNVAYNIMLVGIITLLLIGLLMIVLLEWMLRPIQSLVDTAEAVSEKKDYTLRAKKYSNDELGLLVSSFNRMLTQTWMHERELKKAKQDIEETAYNLEIANKQAEKEREAAEQANQSKSDFLAKMSHELRTPLNSIIGMSDILVSENMAQNHAHMISIIQKSSKALLDVVNDILDISKIEAGTISLEAIAFDLPQVTKDVVETLQPLAKEKGLDLFIRHQPLFPYVVGDPARFKQIVINLIGNAIKYTKQGSVEVDLSFAKSGDEAVQVICAVSDTGIGISEERIEKVFERFTQADDSITRNFGGTGLGLAITKQLTELMNGSITATSTEGKGSTFSVTVPFPTSDSIHDDFVTQKLQESIPSPNNKTIPVSEAKLLIADDNIFNQAFIEKLMSKLGFTGFEIAKDGFETVSKYKEAPYDVILMDCHMPKMDGYKATQLIRAHEEETNLKRSAIVAMTADAMTGVRKKCIDAGMDDYTTKPISQENLLSALGAWIDFSDKENE